MGFGSSGYGSVPFGSTFTSLPTAPAVLYAAFLGADLLRIWFNEDIIINADYLDVSNYLIVDGNLKQLPVMRVVLTKAVSLPYVLLRTKPQIAGQSYNVSVQNLVDRTGVPISSLANSAAWVYNRTKGDSIIASMPDMYDTSASSNLRGLLQSMATELDLIGVSSS